MQEALASGDLAESATTTRTPCLASENTYTRTSENPINTKFAEFLFSALG